MTIKENLESVNERIAKAAERSGRRASDVSLIAVTKTVGIEEVKEAIKCGQRMFAENRVALLNEKINGLADCPEADTLKWHLIGHLQTNKLKYIPAQTELIHSVDSVHLAEALQKEAKKRNIKMKCLLELNVSGEASKSGLAPSDVDEFTDSFAGFDCLSLEGLMTMAPISAELPELHGIFSKTRNISLDIAKKKIDNINMSILSMGMSGDFEVAVEEGATHVRVGTAIFH